MNSIPNLEKTRPATCENAFSTMSAGGESTQPTITTQAKALQLSHSTKLESFLIPSSGWHHSRPQGFSGNQTASGRTVTYRLKFFTPVFINVWLMRPSRESFRQSLALGNGQNRRKKCFFTFFLLASQLAAEVRPAQSRKTSANDPESNSTSPKRCHHRGKLRADLSLNESKPFCNSSSNQ